MTMTHPIDVEGLPSGWRAVTGRLDLSLAVLEDRIPQDMIEDFEIDRPEFPEALRDWFQGIVDRLQGIDDLTRIAMNPDLVSAGLSRGKAPLELYLCSRATMDRLLDAEGALGLHIVTTPDGDPLGEGTDYAEEYRIAIVYDRDEFLRLIRSEAEQDACPSLHLQEYVESWLATLFHEIEHVRLFAQNGALMAPSQIEDMCEVGEFDHDLFDASTGYGIRPLVIDGRPVWAENLEEATANMEAHVEARGRQLLQRTLHGDLDAMSFLKAASLEAEVAKIIEACEASRPGCTT